MPEPFAQLTEAETAGGMYSMYSTRRHTVVRRQSHCCTWRVTEITTTEQHQPGLPETGQVEEAEAKLLPHDHPVLPPQIASWTAT